MTATAAPIMVGLIERKKEGGSLEAGELAWLCREFVDGRVPDYQVAAWLMAIRLRGMSAAETLALTEAMVATGNRLAWSGLPVPPVDKHSTGGVGDKTSLVVVPLIAAAGVPFAKMSGRGLGHTGGTLDKLESIPGFRVDLSPAEMHTQVSRIGCALVGQSPALVPADGLLYALRDVTATVDSLPLIASSIMSKKLAAGARAIVLDVKYGSGAFMPTLERARELAAAMVKIGLGAGVRTRAVLSSMQQPLGHAVGNAPEVREAIESLAGGGPDDLWRLALELGAHLLELSGQADDLLSARKRLAGLRDSGAGSAKFTELIAAQGGDPGVVADPDRLPKAAVQQQLRAERDGWVAALDARLVGDAAIALGAGRRAKGEQVDPAAGILLHARRGEPVRRGEPLAEVHGGSLERTEAAAALLRRAYQFAGEPQASDPEEFEVVDG